MDTQNQEPVKPRVFYSAAANLTVHVSKGKEVVMEGHLTRHGEKFAEFSPQGNGYGQLVTDDPETIAKLEKRDDCFGPERYNELIVPADVRLKAIQDQLASQTRVLRERNDLIAKLEAQAAQQSKFQAPPAQQVRPQVK